MAKTKAKKKKEKKGKQDNNASASGNSEGPSMLAIVGSWFTVASAVATAIDITRQFYSANQTTSEEEAAERTQELIQQQALLREQAEETMPEDMS